METGKYTVHTWHGVDRVHRRRHFTGFTPALEYAESINPDTDGTMIPNGGESFNPPNYESGVFWLGNKYAVITKDR